MTAILQVCLWLFVTCEICEKLAPKLDIMKRRRKLKGLFKMYLRLSKNADSDYKSGFFYGKAKQFELKLNETRYFDYE